MTSQHRTSPPRTALPRRSAASTLLLTRLGIERGVPAQVCLRGTGLDLDDLRRPGAEVDGEQELAVIANLVAGADDPDLPLEAGTRYHLTTYGIWGFALASSPTVGAALEVGARFVDLSFAFCRLTVEQDDVELLVTNPDGLVELYVGTARTTTSWELTTDVVARVDVMLPNEKT